MATILRVERFSNRVEIEICPGDPPVCEHRDLDREHGLYTWRRSFNPETGKETTDMSEGQMVTEARRLFTQEAQEPEEGELLDTYLGVF